MTPQIQPPIDVHVSGRKWFAKYHRSAIAIPSPEFDRLRSIAQKNKVLLSVGVIEKEGGTLYCSAVLIDQDGVLLYNHRKVCSVLAQKVALADTV